MTLYITPDQAEKYINLTDVMVRSTCGFCGVEIIKFPAHIRRNRRRGVTNLFCSRKCQSKGRDYTPVRGEAHGQWKGGTDYRRRALEHYGAFCNSCGYDRERSLLWVHHKDFARSDHSFENLVVLCIRCHLELHLERDRALLL